MWIRKGTARIKFQNILDSLDNVLRKPSRNVDVFLISCWITRKEGICKFMDTDTWKLIGEIGVIR